MCLLRHALIVAAVWSFVAAPAAAQVGRGQVSGLHLFNPFDLNIRDVPAIGQVVDAGRVVCPGHEPTADPLQPCPRGSAVRLHGAQLVSRVELDLDGQPANGWARVEFNANWNADYTGPVWGSLEVQLCDEAPVVRGAGVSVCPDGRTGAWEGVWFGVRKQSGAGFVIESTIAGYGVDGWIDGYEFELSEQVYFATLTPVAWKGFVVGRVFVPGQRR
jgi:hypothetical protein